MSCGVITEEKSEEDQIDELHILFFWALCESRNGFRLKFKKM